MKSGIEKPAKARKTRGRGEQDTPDESITSEVAIRQIRAATFAPSGQALAKPAAISAEVRWVYYCLKVWGEVSPAPPAAGATPGPEAPPAVSYGKPTAPGTVIHFGPGEYITRARYNMWKAPPKFKKGRIVLCKSGTDAGHAYTLYCNSLVLTFFAFYYGIHGVPDQIFWPSIESVLAGVATFDITNNYDIPPKTPKIIDNPFVNRFSRVGTFTPTTKAGAMEQMIQHVAGDHHGFGARGLGALYAYSRNGGSHTGMLTWYRGAVWKIAADGIENRGDPIVCGPCDVPGILSTADTGKHTTKLDLFKATACDPIVPPLLLLLEEDPKDDETRVHELVEHMKKLEEAERNKSPEDRRRDEKERRRQEIQREKDEKAARKQREKDEKARKKRERAEQKQREKDAPRGD